MARGKRKVAERDYEKLISSTKECIEKLETKSVEIREELRSKKDELKNSKEISRIIRFKKLKRKNSNRHKNLPNYSWSLV